VVELAGGAAHGGAGAGLASDLVGEGAERGEQALRSGGDDCRIEALVDAGLACDHRDAVKCHQRRGHHLHRIVVQLGRDPAAFRLLGLVTAVLLALLERPRRLRGARRCRGYGP
jgi:hypothetical protein